MTTSTSRNCGFCGEKGHTMFACTHPAVDYINTKFDEGLRESPETPFPVLHWLENQPAKTVRIIAHKNHVPHSGKKWDMIASLLDLHYSEYQNKLWHLPKEECDAVLDKFHKIIASILHFQKELVNIGILEEEPYKPNMLYTMALPDVFTIYTDMYTKHSTAFIDIVTNFNRQFKITLLRTQLLDLVEEEEDCPICYDALVPANSIRLNCGHSFCESCIIKILTKNRKEKCAGTLPFCAMCRCRYKTFSIQPGEKELENKIEPFLYTTTRTIETITTEV
jgi:hypothetical protein